MLDARRAADDDSSCSLFFYDSSLYLKDKEKYPIQLHSHISLLV